MPLRVLAALVALLLIPATASASYDGSTGKVAYVDSENGLYIDDPFDDQPAQGPLATVASEVVQTKAMAMPSPPAWSPDGTLLAYSAPVDDSFGMKHSAIFVTKADGTGAHQVSHPFALEPDTCVGQCDNGHASLDHSPTWTPDGKIAFIRMVDSGDESPRVSERGTSVRVVDPAGGGQTQRYYLEPKAHGLIFSIVWPTSSIHPFAILGDRPDKTFSLRNLGTNVDIVSAPGITDLDASPVGQTLAYTTLVGGPRVHVSTWAGRELESFETGLHHAPGPLHARRQLDRPQGLRQGPRSSASTAGSSPTGSRIRTATSAPTTRSRRRSSTAGAVPPAGARPAGARTSTSRARTCRSSSSPASSARRSSATARWCWMPAVPPIDDAADGPVGGRAHEPDVPERREPPASPSARSWPPTSTSTRDEWLEKLDPPAGGATFGWDWRKAPQDSLDELERQDRRAAGRRASWPRPRAPSASRSSATPTAAC